MSETPEQPESPGSGAVQEVKDIAFVGAGGKYMRLEIRQTHHPAYLPGQQLCSHPESVLAKAVKTKLAPQEHAQSLSTREKDAGL